MQSSDTLLSPRDAEDVVLGLLETFGLGSVPEVKVLFDQDGAWIIRYGRTLQHHAPMTGKQWHDWLEERLGPNMEERLACTEG